MNLKAILEGVQKARQTLEALRTAQAFVREAMPTIRAVMDTADELIPEGGKGQQKLDYVRNTVTSAWTIAGAAQEFVESVWPLVEKAIAAICAARKTQPK